MPGENIVVAVRVRPFNGREKKLKSKLCIEMDGKQTIIKHPEGKEEQKRFTFDYSYWSHTTDHPNFANNQTLFKDLGGIVLQNAWEGFNCCLLAYGQTGAGKSYSMVGYGEDKGIVPLSCEEMFKRMEADKNPDVQYIVEVSMLEIYNENVQDLLNPDSRSKSGLRVRDHPVMGPYAEGLTSHVVSTYEEISGLMELGTKNRTVQATKMNKTSSRAHTIFLIKFVTRTYDAETKKKSDKTSKINLVDLAGSERISKTGAKGSTLREGVNINKSLSALGNVINALSKTLGHKKKKKVHIPYRDSKLTWLLKQSLGGNSKTIMIAAISPALDNFDESMQTLRYANRAKMIKNRAKINEDENARVIKELKAEIARLKMMTQRAGSVPIQQGDSAKDRELAEMREKLLENERLIKEQNETYESKLKRLSTQKLLKRQRSMLKDMRQDICLINLNQDEQMDGVLVFILPQGYTKVCREDSQPPPGETDIVVGGLQIQREHAEILRSDDEVTVGPVGTARVYINGKPIMNPRKLAHNDRILFGAHNYYRYVVPKKRQPSDKRYGFAFARQEFASQMFQIEEQEEDYKERLEQREKERAEMEAKMRSVEEENKKLVASMHEKKKAMQEKLKKLEKDAEKQIAKKMAQIASQHSKDQAAKQRLKEELERKKHEFEEQKRKLQESIEKKTQQAREENKKLQQQVEQYQASLAKQSEQNEKDENNMRLLREKLIQMLPLVNEANAMCQELGKKLFFGIRIVADKGADKDAYTQSAEALVEIVELEDGKKSLWSHEQLMDRMADMQEAYQNHIRALEEKRIEVAGATDEAFQFDTPGPQLIGTSMVYLEPLLYLMPIHVFTPILSYKGEVCGKLRVSIIPDLKEESFEAVDNLGIEEQLVRIKGHPIKITIMVTKALNIPKELSKECFCEYQFYLEEKTTYTDPVAGATTSPVLKHSREIIIDPVSDNLIRYVRESALKIKIFGTRPRGDEAKDTKRLNMEAQLAIDEISDIKEMLAAEMKDPKQQKFPATQQLQELIAKHKAMGAEILELKGLLADDKRNEMLLKVVQEKKELDKKFSAIHHENEVLKTEKNSQASKLSAFKKQLEDADEAQMQYNKDKMRLKEIERKFKSKEDEIAKLQDEHVSQLTKLRKKNTAKTVEDLESKLKTKDEEILRLRAELAAGKKSGAFCCA